MLKRGREDKMRGVALKKIEGGCRREVKKTECGGGVRSQSKKFRGDVSGKLCLL